MGGFEDVRVGGLADGAYVCKVESTNISPDHLDFSDKLCFMEDERDVVKQD